MSLKVVSYNIHKGLNLSGLSKSIETIKKLLIELQPDIVMLQEVIGAHKSDKFKINNWPNQAQFEFLADEFWPHYAYGQNAVYTQGNHGNCILSKYPISKWKNIDISTNKYEKRGLLHVTINLPDKNKSVELLSTHLNLLQGSRKKQTLKIIDYIETNIDKHSSLVFCGDFNDWKNKVTSTLNERLELKEINLELHGRLLKTYPSHFPILKLDRIYYKNLKPISTKLDSSNLDLRLSDHLPILGQFEFNA